MPNLDLWINQQNSNEDTTTTISNFENCLLSIRDQYQKIRLQIIQSPMNVMKKLLK
jgi:hypothetical protein